MPPVADKERSNGPYDSLFPHGSSSGFQGNAAHVEEFREPTREGNNSGTPAVLKHFQARMLYGLVVPDVEAD